MILIYNHVVDDHTDNDFVDDDHAGIVYHHHLLVPSWGPDHPEPELGDGLHHQDKRVEIY